MTTVINLNILNVYGQMTEKSSVRNSQLNSDNSKRRDISFPDHRTIDVTPSNAPVSHYKPALKKIREVPVMLNDQPEVLTCYAQKCDTRILNAYSNSSYIPTGTYVDSYA